MLFKNKMHRSVLAGACSLALLAGTAAPAFACSYDYGVQCNASTTSGYTWADRNTCTVTTVSYWVNTAGTSTSRPRKYGSYNYNTKQATVVSSVPAGGSYFTSVYGTHTIGINTYTSSNVR